MPIRGRQGMSAQIQRHAIRCEGVHLPDLILCQHRMGADFVGTGKRNAVVVVATGQQGDCCQSDPLQRHPSGCFFLHL